MNCLNFENKVFVRFYFSTLNYALEYFCNTQTLQDQIDIVSHKFQAGWKLEALNPITRNQICPATVRQILDSKYFVVEIDDLQCTDPYGRIRFSCHAKSRCIFPAQWCLWKGLRLTPPKGK